jgi:hypothetical protein
MQLVDLSRAVHVLCLPHPLLADDVDLHRPVGWPRQVEEHLRAPDEHHHRDAERDDGPEQLERQRTVDRLANLVVVLAVELDREHDDQERDEPCEERADRDQEEVQGIDLRCLLGCRLREERKVREHSFKGESPPVCRDARAAD